MDQKRPPKPVLAEPFPIENALWTDPITGLVVPKEPAANMQWRVRLLKAAEKDPALRADLLAACRDSILFWINAFVFTHRVFVVDDDGTRRTSGGEVETHVPMVTWAFQDTHILHIQRAINEGFDLLTDKCREMGATWNHLVVLHHQWMFIPGRSFLEISRKEDCVDTGGTKTKAGYLLSDPGTLFGKHDYINRWTPEWMLPNMRRTTMHYVNLDNDSRIDGETANATAGSSDRRTAILLDEMAKMAEGSSIKRSTRDVTACRLPCSTPNGAGTAYSQWFHSGQIKIHTLAWWEHPEKGRGRYVEWDTRRNSWWVRSPWYALEELARSPKEMAIEIDRDHIGSGDTYFETTIVEQHKSLYAKDPQFQYDISLDETIANAAVKDIYARHKDRDNKEGPFYDLKRNAKGDLKVWANLIEGRIDQTKTYTMGIDIGKGQGASNSVVAVRCNETGVKVAEWASAQYPPYDFARIVVALALWIGGGIPRKLPFVIWEANGDPGIDFGKVFFRQFAYPYCFIDGSQGKITEKKSKSYGFHSSRDKKSELLGNYRRLLAHGGFINPSKLALDEAVTYVYYSSGGIGPATLQEESDTAKKTHGDRVIADALACWPDRKESGSVKASEMKIPHNSAGGRMQEAIRKKQQGKKKKGWGSFNFR